MKWISLHILCIQPKLLCRLHKSQSQNCSEECTHFRSIICGAFVTINDSMESVDIYGLNVLITYLVFSVSTTFSISVFFRYDICWLMMLLSILFLYILWYLFLGCLLKPKAPYIIESRRISFIQAASASVSQNFYIQLGPLIFIPFTEFSCIHIYVPILFVASCVLDLHSTHGNSL